ncbi:MAG: ABC transporter ATP-binding protein/permease [Lachnospiraceae bacterium]|nr:ABC transporter ATP-binding protein/permease [Lachnospiraceae bacterium]
MRSFIDRTLETVTNLVLYLYIGAKAYIGTFGVGNFFLYTGAVDRFLRAVSDLGGSISSLRQNNDYLIELYRYLDLPDDMYRGTLSVEKREDNKFEIEFRNVSFRYPGSDTYALKNVSFKFRIGERLAFVGMNGSGKTTFVKLLCRLYDPTEGQILLKGIDISKYNYDEYVKLFSVVFQDYFTFAFSLGENVSAKQDYDAEKVWSCLKKVGVGDKFSETERGLDTPLGFAYQNDGVEISGGEAQKVALARALYKDAPYIILDEPTAALDPIAEAEVYSKFNEIVEDKTAIYISHRLSSCRLADKILVFHDGEIVQQGSHDQLVTDTSGKYYELWNAQAQYYV